MFRAGHAWHARLSTIRNNLPRSVRRRGVARHTLVVAALEHEPIALQRNGVHWEDPAGAWPAAIVTSRNLRQACRRDDSRIAPITGDARSSAGCARRAHAPARARAGPARRADVANGLRHGTLRRTALGIRNACAQASSQGRSQDLPRQLASSARAARLAGPLRGASQRAREQHTFSGS
jgi:hypothetical protein